MTTFNLFTFFHADFIQSKVSRKLSLAHDWIMKECAFVKSGHTFGFLVVRMCLENEHVIYMYNQHSLGQLWNTRFTLWKLTALHDLSLAKLK